VEEEEYYMSLPVAVPNCNLMSKEEFKTAQVEKPSSVKVVLEAKPQSDSCSKIDPTSKR
jgi:hypothetical protein